MNKKTVLSIYLTLLLFSVRYVTAEKSAPPFTLTDIDGVEFSLGDYRGKVVLLDFLSTLCPPCIAGISHLKSLQFGEDLTIISISVRYSDTVEKLQEFRQEHEIDWIIARDTIGVHEIYSIHTIPTLVIVDQQGYIRYVHVNPDVPAARTLSQEVDYMIPRALIGDINGDGTVNIIDISLVALAFGSEPGHPNWNARADLNNDEVINILDVALAASEFGKAIEDESPFNFLPNPSVEIDENGDNLPEYWKKEDYGDVSAVHTWLDTGHMGNRSIKASITHNTSALGWHSAYWHQSFQIQCSPFEVRSRYLFRVWYKSSIRCHIYVGFWDGDGQWFEGQSLECELATTWTLSQRLEFTIPEGTYRMAVGISIRNSDADQETDAYVIGDDFELIRE